MNTWAVIGWLSSGLAFCGVAYTLFAAWLVRRSAPQDVARNDEPVTLLKPLHFEEPGLEANLASFMTQDYDAPVQVVLGVQSPSDTAIPIAQKLKELYRGSDIALTVDPREHGTNRKVSNLINMLEHARHPILVLSDSDIRVGPGYLRGVTRALKETDVGAVTALYVGRPSQALWAGITAMGISYQFLPNVLVGVAIGIAKPCFGSTIALRRKTLEEIGGFEAVANRLADDYEIGHAVRRLGFTVALAPGAVEHVCTQATPSDWVNQELRWARTIAAIDPAGHAGSAVTFPVAWAVLALVSTPGWWSVGVVLAAVGARAVLKLRVDNIFKARSGPIWLLPVRDIFAFAIFLASFAGRSVEWRGRGFRVAEGALSEHLRK